MLNYVIIADDLTGANATGVLIKKIRIKTCNANEFFKKR